MDERHINCIFQIKDKNKRSLSNTDDDISINSSQSTEVKRHRIDLTCVVCQGPAYGYNYAQISCRSCKEFFRRTALLPIEETKCNNKKSNQCEIRFDIKQKCQRCRLIKCFEKGMRKDYLITPEEKLLKQERIEANRRIRSEEIILQQTTVDTQCSLTQILTDIDRICLSHIQKSYKTAMESVPSASTMFPFNHLINKTYSFFDLTEIDQYIPIKLIYFLRSIPEFESLNEHDRLALVKYNFIPMFELRDVLIYDSNSHLLYDDIKSIPPSYIDEKFAHNYTSLCTLFYGYDNCKIYESHLHLIQNIVNNNSLIIQLLMIVLIFLKGTSINNDQQWILYDPKSVFNAHIKYVDLLFRYLINEYSYNLATN